MAAIIIAFSAMTSSGVLQPGDVPQPHLGGFGMGSQSEIHAPSFVLGERGSVKGVEAFRGTPRPDAAPTPSAKPSERPPVATKKAGPRPGTPSPVRTKPVARPGGASGVFPISGSATWYCCTRGHSSGEYVAAAGPALRVGNWRGRYVTVCASRCIRVRLVDWCGCPGHVIDLHPGAFRSIAPLSRGVVSVRVSW